MRVETVAEVLVRAGAVAFADGARGVDEGPDGQADAEGDEGFFFEATGELLPAVFIEEFTEMVVSWGESAESIAGETYLSRSKEEGRGASDILNWNQRQGRYPELSVIRSCQVQYPEA